MTKECETCGKIFELTKIGNIGRWCINCRESEHRKTAKENSGGLYRRNDPEKARKRYIKLILPIIIRGCERIKKRRNRVSEINGMRKLGTTYTEIGKRFGVTKQRAQQICKSGY